MKTMVLAARKGTRLLPLTGEGLKPVDRVVGKPIIEHSMHHTPTSHWSISAKGIIVGTAKEGDSKTSKHTMMLLGAVDLKRTMTTAFAVSPSEQQCTQQGGTFTNMSDCRCGMDPMDLLHQCPTTAAGVRAIAESKDC